MDNNIPKIELCKYTLRQSLCDTGEYLEFPIPQYLSAQELLEESE